MADHDRKFVPEPDDLPLSSIPSVPRSRVAEPERRGRGGYLLGAAAVFAAIVAVSFVLAPYLKLPEVASESAPERPVALAARDAPTDPVRLPATAAPEPAAPERAAPEPALDEPPARPDLETRIAGLERDLDAKESSLLESQRELDRERKARRAAQAKLDDAQKSLKSGRSDTATLERRIEELTSARAAADRTAAERIRELEARAAAAEQSATRASEELAAERRRATEATDAVSAADQRMSAALQAEGDAVRRLLAELEAERAAAESERSARRAAEQRVRELEAERSAARSEAPPRTAQAAAPPTESIALTSPERLKTVPPRYPDDLRRQRISGRVLLRLLVDEMGNVADIEVQDSPHPRLATVAKNAARQWKYVPARRDGVRVSTWVSEAVDFQL